jgi:hypothetical protein
MIDEPLRMQILNMIERGDITAKEGLRWLEALAKNESGFPSLEEETANSAAAKMDPLDRTLPEAEAATAEVGETLPPPAAANQLP